MTEIRGMIQSASALTGTLSNQGSITGDIAGLRGLKGDKGDPGEKGDTGDTGATGNGISSAILNSDYTLTLNFTDGTSYTTTAIRGEKGDTGDTGLKGDTGDTGNGIASIAKTGTQGLVDTYTITFTNGTITTFTVTNGQNGSGSVADVWVNNVSVLDGDTAKVTVPTKTSDITNDSGFITTETDPTVSAWAKSSTKPSYAYSEISGTPTLADVATSGDYDDLINTPNVATVVELTQAQYDALTPVEKNNGTVYCVSDASGTYLTASEVSYGSSSVQDALDSGGSIEYIPVVCGGQTIQTGFCKNKAHVVNAYLEVNNLDSSATTITIINPVPDSLLPKQRYALLSVFSASAPYQPIGSFWINRDGKYATIYKPSGETSVYIAGAYLAKD